RRVAWRGEVAGEQPNTIRRIRHDFSLGTVSKGDARARRQRADVDRIAHAWSIGPRTVRPSRRPLRGLLRMRFFLNAINLPHPEERPEGASRRTHDARTATFSHSSAAIGAG